MATLYQSPCFLYLSSHKLRLNQEEYSIISNAHHYPPRKDFNFCICSANKSRGGRKVKSKVELCNDIREFVSAVGLPEGHVPSMKELSDHGRIDLAHIVRRRGYKFIRELLSNSIESELECNREKRLDEGKGATVDGLDISTEGQDEKVEDVIDNGPFSTEVSVQDHSCSVSLDEYVTSSILSYNIEEQDDKFQHGVEDISLSTSSDNVEQRDREVLNMVEDKPLSTEVNSLSGYSGSDSDINTFTPIEILDNSSSQGQDEEFNSLAEDISLRTEVSDLKYHASDGEIALGLNSGVHSCMPLDPAANTSLEDKVAKFIQSGDLDVIEYNVYGILDESAGESNGSNELENETEIQSKTPFEENNKYAAVKGSNASLALNGSMSLSHHVNPPVTTNHTVRNDRLSAEDLANSDLDKNLDVETSKRENQVEINHLKFMLHQKELELSRLKEHIEKEKLTLSDLQTKAEMEISRAQKLISEKDAELLAAEESLSGLVEVKIQYNGDGEIVEVAGSFNGWHHRIRMDPEPSSIIDPGSRKSKLWSTMLWLYPGVYEIKFIVDGHWTIDPQAEMVSRGGISNNVLRVVG